MTNPLYDEWLNHRAYGIKHPRQPFQCPVSTCRGVSWQKWPRMCHGIASASHRPAAMEISTPGPDVFDTEGLVIS